MNLMKDSLMISILFKQLKLLVVGPEMAETSFKILWAPSGAWHEGGGVLKLCRLHSFQMKTAGHRLEIPMSGRGTEWGPGWVGGVGHGAGWGQRGIGRT